jgi:hypothetical protein
VALAYCILAHKNPGQVARLLRAIWHSDNFYVLHYERRAPKAEHRSIREIAKGYANVRVLAPRAILWGRYSQVATQFAGLQLCLEESRRWSHFMTLTGQDFPLKPQAAMIQELAGYPELSYVSHFDPFDGYHWKNAEERLRRIHLDWPLLEAILSVPGIGRRLRHLLGWTNRMPYVPFLKREQPVRFTYFGGSNHVILSREAAAYIVSDPAAEEVIHWLRWTGHPDESVYQSTLLNSRFAALTVNDDRRAVFWAKAGDPSPRTLDISDLERLHEARNSGKLFARKFDPKVDESLIGELEKEIANHGELVG